MLSVIILTIFRGLRWETGTDWKQYLEVFQMASWSNIFSLTRGTGESMEFGYVFLNVIVKTFGGNYTVFLFLTNFFVLVSYLVFSLKLSRYPIWTFASILLSINFFPVRQDIAIAVLYFALLAILDHNNKKALVLIGIASSIHNISICFLLVFLFSRFEFSYSKMTLYIVGSILAAFIITVVVTRLLPILILILPSGISVKISAYLDRGGEIEDGIQKKGLSSYLMIFVFMYANLAYYLLRKPGLNNRERRKERIMVNSMVISYLIQLIVTGPLYYFSRIANFFMIPNSLLMVNSTVYLFNKYKVGFIKRVSPFVILLLLFFFRLYKLLQVFPTEHFPYKTIFEF
jgi:hypothetical protein